MAKGRGMPPMGGMNMNSMIRQAQKLQDDMERTRNELDAKEYEFTAAGVVTAKVSGKKELLALTISPETVDPEDVEMLSDTIVAAVNGALKAASDDAEGAMKRLTGGMNMPGLF